MGGGVMIEEDTIVDIPLEADTVGVTGVGQGATLHTERRHARLDGYEYRRTGDSRNAQSHQSRCRGGLYLPARRRSRDCSGNGAYQEA